MNEKKCLHYLGVACIDGNCPIALDEEYAEYGIPVIDTCDDCHLYKGCEDCAWDAGQRCRYDNNNNLQSVDRLLR